MKRYLLMAGCLIVIGAAATRAYACQCAGENAPCAEYWKVSAVFVGTVIESRLVTVKETSYDRQMRSVRIFVDEPLRGVEGAEVEVLTGMGGGDCGFGFQRAQQYIVYAYRSEQDNKLHTSICTRTRLMTAAGEDLKYIRGLGNAKRGGTISGEVARFRRNAEGNIANEPLPAVKVVVEGPKSYETVTDAKGQYGIEGVMAGDYTIRPIAPPGLALRGPDRTIKVADPGCADVSLWLESNAHLSGRVLNPQGLPVPKAEIFMMAADKEKYQGHWDAAYADDEGKYLFKLVSPGSYLLTVRYDGLTSQNQPFPIVYYPGVADKSQAQVLVITEGQAIDNYDLLVPNLPKEYEVRGVVTWPDGKAAPGAHVGYLMVDDSVMYGATMDEQGRFTFKAYEGLKLTLRASLETEKGKYSYSKWVQVTVEPDTQPVKLVLSPGNQ